MKLPRAEQPSKEPKAPKWNVRAALPEDIDAIERIERASFKSPWSRRALSEEISCRSWSQVSVVETAQGVVGYMIFWRVAGELHLLNLAVSPSCRRQGAASILIEQLIEAAVQGGQNQVFLEVRKSNTAAKRLYTEAGFVEIGVRPGYYSDNGEDAVLMGLRIEVPSPSAP